MTVNSGRRWLFAENMGGLIRERRQDKGWSQEALARNSGVDRGAISSIERGVYATSAYNICCLARALECRVDDLIPDA